MSKHSLIVIGEINTDIIINGLPHFPKKGELVNGERLTLGPGGKSRNIAAMAGLLMPKGQVAMVSKTSKDPYGLWQIPLTALEEAGVDTSYIQVVDDMKFLPGFAVILVDKQGTNQIIGAPGVTRTFAPKDISIADVLFQEVSQNNGIMAFIGNCPVATARYAVKKAGSLGIKVVFDPGGADDIKQLEPLLNESIYIFKPNEHEAKMLTGIEVTNFDTAKQAAEKLQKQGVVNVLITHGAKGAYLFSETVQLHIPIPKVKAGKEKDETGCGDQTMAALCALLQDGKSIHKAAELAILAGTLQFYRTGIQPVTLSELLKS